ncbi:MAG: hypothetical protein CBD11_01030 [Phycisphaera sp. TMED151]|nr:MAG: hypothetical protein CBD11_01030 [Phycisphaera sp. TMED151]RPG10738.1 MAG: hypothetical protein CBB84_000140 [Phycisphaera sp. TMED24]|tara:strand:+ start:239 stop:1321 length:1083 start_codon:yes stop_codon:yes gene_type:complete
MRVVVNYYVIVKKLILFKMRPIVFSHQIEMNIGDVLLQFVLMYLPWNETSIKCVSRRFCEIMASPEYLAAFKMCGYAERVVILLSLPNNRFNMYACRVLAGNWQRYTRRKPPHQIPVGACQVVHDNELMVIGGADRDSCPPRTTDRVDKFCPGTNKWIEHCTLKERRQNCVGCSVGHDVIVAGGTDLDIFNKPVKTAEIFRSSTGKWEIMPKELLNPSIMSAACVLNGQLYIAAGLYYNKLQVWDGTKWYYKADLPVSELYSAACIAIDGRMWLIGGMVVPEGRTLIPEISSTVLIYDPEKNTWKYGPELPEPRYSCNVVIFNGYLIMFGGHGFSSRNEPEPLMLIDGRWSKLSTYKSLD